MHKKHISYPKIVQFRNIVASIKRQVQFVGLNSDGNAIYDPNAVLPSLTFTGTIKLHGTNAAVCFNEIDGMWFQSRSRIITPESDNAGFAFFADVNQRIFENLIRTISYDHKIDITQNTISIYGEWAGEGIQKNVAISQLPRAFYIFGIKVTPHDERNSYWIDSNLDYLKKESNKIYNIYDFTHHKLEIDFNDLSHTPNDLISITEDVENKCPVASQLGEDGIGEGIVWSCEYGGIVHRFKVKGEKHSTSKVKKLAPVDSEKIKQREAFLDYSVTKNRLSQACDEVFGIGNEPDIKGLGNVIRWMINDINTEEKDIMTERGLFPKDINKHIAGRVRKIFMN